jgi:hypothetical protein
MIFIRKALDYVFTKDELRVLDSIIPPLRKSKKKYGDSKASLETAEPFSKPGSINELSHFVRNNTSSASVNMSDEVVKSGAWLHVHQKTASFRT